jgi:hypothetical protein
MADQKRRYERIDIDLPCRLFIPEEDKKGGLRLQAFTMSKNLGLGGVFVESTFLLKAGLELWVELKLPSESLAIRGQVAHAVPLDHSDYLSGMGIEFLDVDSHGRETLLRYFTPERYHVFYDAMTKEFPHLSKEFENQDVSLIVNLWEEWKIRAAGGPLSTASGAPEPPARRDRRR